MIAGPSVADPVTTHDGELRTVVRDDGVSLRYRVWPVPQPRATVVLFNGIMSHSLWFRPLQPALAAAGYTVVGADRRGSGPNAEHRGDALSASVLVDDARAVIAAEHDGTRPLVVVGWCWGSILAVHLALALGSGIDRLVLVTPGLCPTAEVRDAAAAGASAAKGRADDEPCVPTPIRDELFTDGWALEQFIRVDPLRLQAITPRFAALSHKLSSVALTRLPRITVPTLLVLAEHDGATDNAQTLTAFERIGAERRRVVTLPTHHGVSFEAPAALAAAIVEFVDAPPEPKSEAPT